MKAYSFQIVTEPGVGTHDLMDRVADLLDDSVVISFPAITLDARTASLSLTFEASGRSPMSAATSAMLELGRVFGAAIGAQDVDVEAQVDLTLIEFPASRIAIEPVAA